LAQASNVGGVRPPRGSRVALAAALACWAICAAVFAALPTDTGRFIVANVVYCAAAAFAVIGAGRATLGARGRGRLFWGLFVAGLVAGFVGDVGWSEIQGPAFATQEVSYQHVAYLVSYLLLGCALLSLVHWTTKNITLVTSLDSLCIMLSVGTLVWYFFVGGAVAEAGPDGSPSVFMVLTWPLFDAALVFLSLVVFSTAGRPPSVGLLLAGFLAFAVADGVYLGARSGGTYGAVGWPDLIWALGLLFLGFAALGAVPTTTPAGGSRIGPWRIFVFWLGPLSPPLHFAVVLLWGVTHPPLPLYVLVGAAVLFIYLALRVALVSFVSRRLGNEREEMTRKLEQNRVLYELHDTVKQSVHGITLTLRAALDAERRGEPGVASEMIGRALEASREAEYRVSKPYDDLLEEGAPTPGEHLRTRLQRFEEYFGVKTHEDFRVPFESLSPDEISAAQRVFVEASWNVAKHSGARNLWLETRKVGDVIIVRTRDDGRGFDPSDPPPGLGLRYMRRRAGEAGAELDVISAPGRGTTVQLRFDKG
jgi:signal transduction histidine kinase